MAAATLNIFHAHADRVKMANIAQTVNVLQAMLLTDGAKMAKTPSYHVFAMYLPFQDATSLPVEVKAPMLTIGKNSFPAFNVSAARGKDGKVHVAVANLDADKGAVDPAGAWDHQGQVRGGSDSDPQPDGRA